MLSRRCPSRHMLEFCVDGAWCICASITHVSGTVFRAIDRAFLRRCHRLDRVAEDEREEQIVGERRRVGVGALEKQHRHNFEGPPALSISVSCTTLVLGVWKRSLANL